MMPFLKLSAESARRMWQVGRSDGLIKLVNEQDWWKMEPRWLKFISDHKRARTPKRPLKVSIGWRYPLPYDGD